MLKFIQLKFLKIKYSGDSIGDDIRIEVGILNHFLRVDKIVKIGATAGIDREIGSFETDQKIFESVLRLTVIEKDLLFNDVGNIDYVIKIDTSAANPQQFVYKTQVKESRSFRKKVGGKRTAIFEIILEARVTDAIRYVPDEADGWLKVKLEDINSVESLPAYLKVRVDRTDNKREYFTILEGVYRGTSASVKLKEDESSQFVFDIQHEPAVYTSYSISKKVFTLAGKTYTTADYKNSPWKKGLYDIEIPDAPHRAGARYPEAKRAKTWFRIGHAGERYLHAGGQSLGCITVIETIRWMEIYNALIKARKGDFMSIGVLDVVD